MNVYPPGTRIGQFEVISYPLSSELSIDYTCLDHERSCPALLKTLRPELLASRKARDCFSKSGAAWMRLGAHPHIVCCHNMLESENSDEIYLVLQAVVPEKKRTSPSLLAWFLPGTPLPVLQALLFALQIARGMHYVVDLMPGFVHGDLKPECILVNGGRLLQADINRLRVTDFGLAAVLCADDISLPKTLKLDETAISRTQLIRDIVGTPLYMSPEQWRGEIAGTATDIYALGCILYRMLVGRHPVAGRTVQDLHTTHTTGNVRPLPANLPDPVIELVKRCLELEPGERYQSWQEVETAIAVAYEGTVNQPVPEEEPMDTLTESERVLNGWFLNSMGCASSEVGKRDTAVKCLEIALRVGETEGDQALVGSATSNLGETYRKLGNTQLAIELNKKALTIAKEIGDPSIEGSALNNLGNVYLQLGNPRQAIDYVEQALEVARKNGDRLGEMASLEGLGNVFHQLGDLRRSFQYHEQCLEITRKLGDRRGESITLTNLGAVYMELGDIRHAIQLQEQSLKIKSEIGDRYSQVANLNNLGNAYRDLGNAQRAFEYYNQALEIAREISNRRSEAFALNNMGSAYAYQGRIEQALEYHERALGIFREIGGKRSQGDCLTNLGYIYQNRKDIKQAMSYCEQALAIDREIGDDFGLALDSFNMANLLVQENRFSEALSFAEESANILEKIGHTGKAPQARQLVTNIQAELSHQPLGAAGKSKPGPVYENHEIMDVRRNNPQLTAKMSDKDILELLQQADQAIANDRPTAFVVRQPDNVQSGQEKSDYQEYDNKSMDELIVVGQRLAYSGQWQNAERAFQTLLNKATQANNIINHSLALLFQGQLYGDRGDQLLALSLFRQALSLAKLTEDLKLVHQIYDHMGIAFYRQGSYKEAIEHHNFAIEICKHIGDVQGTLISQAYLGNVYREQGDFERAIRAYKDLLDYTTRIGAEQATGQVYCNLGIVYHRQGLCDLAIEMELKSLDIASRIGDQLTIANACGILGTLRTEQNDFPAAVQMIRKALEIKERLGIERDVALKYADLARLYTQMGESMFAFLSYDRALFYSERIGDFGDQAKIHLNMGRLYRQQGKTAQAREQFQKARDIFDSLGESEKAKRAAIMAANPETLEDE
jgi:tetratricopeptide (TPR) repeat protein